MKPEDFPPAESEKKLTKEPVGKWIEIGVQHVICDLNGKIIASVTLNAVNAVKSPIAAYVRQKDLGRYISVSHAKRAVMRELGNSDAEHQGIIDKMISRFQKTRDDAEPPVTQD